MFEGIPEPPIHRSGKGTMAMNKKNFTFPALIILVITQACAQLPNDRSMTTKKGKDASSSTTTTEEQWRERLTPEQYRILREKGTERAFSGAYWDHHEHGTYTCAACGRPLFSSAAKFDSGTGWPSYAAPVDGNALEEHTDRTFGMVRNEVVCGQCGGHLGHVFDDGPAPTGLRYCINSASLGFDADR